MMTLPELAADALGAFLASDMKDRFGASHARLAELVPFAARLSLECIGNSDALYHNVEHTMLVTLAGHDIFKGRALLLPSTPSDYSNFIVACLTHDIGYVRGVVKGDGDEATSSMPPAARCPCRAAAPMPRLPLIMSIGRSCSCWTVWRKSTSSTGRGSHVRSNSRASPTRAETEESIDEEGSLLRAADLIGQLGDPNYLRKANALYYEFEESGLNKQFGYETPADLVDKYPQFYWNSVSPHIQAAIRYLNITSSGRRGSPASTAMSFAPSAR